MLSFADLSILYFEFDFGFYYKFFNLNSKIFNLPVLHRFELRVVGCANNFVVVAVRRFSFPEISKNYFRKSLISSKIALKKPNKWAGCHLAKNTYDNYLRCLGKLSLAKLVFLAWLCFKKTFSAKGSNQY